jgi:hypothetical protein
MVRVISKDVGEVKDKFDKSVCCSPGVEDAAEVYIKLNMRIRE